MAITTVVFDFGNVLGFFSHQRAAQQLSAYTKLSPREIAAAYVATNLEDDFEAGRITPDEFRRRMRAACRLTCSDEELDRALGDMFWANEEICTLIPQLKEKYRLLLLSNTNAIHANWFQRQFAETLAHFDHLVLSHEVRIRKPHFGIYHHTREKAGVPAEECLFIDDLDDNIAAARVCGWKGLVYRPGNDIHQRLADFGIHIAKATP